LGRKEALIANAICGGGAASEESKAKPKTPIHFTVKLGFLLLLT